MAKAAEITAITLIIIASGKATSYNPGVMDGVVANRVKWKHIDITQPHIGYVALQDKRYLGKRIFLEFPGGYFEGPFLVADCGKESDQEHLNEIDFSVDLSYELAVRYGVVKKPLWGVKVWLVSDGNSDYVPE
jgi:hypothetical protein